MCLSRCIAWTGHPKSNRNRSWILRHFLGFLEAKVSNHRLKAYATAPAGTQRQGPPSFDEFCSNDPLQVTISLLTQRSLSEYNALEAHQCNDSVLHPSQLESDRLVVRCSEFTDRFWQFEITRLFSFHYVRALPVGCCRVALMPASLVFF